MPGTLYVVATPIGNLADITLRAIDVLKTVDLIAAEDTRHTKILLQRYDITTPVTSYFEYNKIRKTDYLVGELAAGKSIALVSDAGTPGISDPGATIIKLCIENHIPVMPIPGPSAVITALTASGKPTDRFAFHGFLATKEGKRRTQLTAIRDAGITAVLYESPYRIVKLLGDIIAVFGDIDIVVARELTKKFEEIRRERASALHAHFSSRTPKGEFIVII